MNLTSVILAICIYESLLVYNAINFQDGSSASYGQCQIKFYSAKQIGYQGYISDLWLNPKVNSEYAKRYLEWQYKRYGNWEEAIAAYNSGTVKYNKKGQLVNKRYVEGVVSLIEKNKNNVKIQ